LATRSKAAPPAFYPIDGVLHGVAWATGETCNLRNWLRGDALA